MELIAFSPDHFSLIKSWVPTPSDLVQWGGPFLTFPLCDMQLNAMLAEGQRHPPTRLCWMATGSQGPGYVGHAQVAFDWRNGNALLGRVAVEPERRGQGIAHQMLSLVVDKAFEFEDIYRIELSVFTWNAPAVAAYKRLGFQFEGVRRQSALVGDVRWDTAIMSLLRDERDMR